jgi:hypothetical protein
MKTIVLHSLLSLAWGTGAVIMREEQKLSVTMLVYGSTLCILVRRLTYQRFGETHSLHLQPWRWQQMFWRNMLPHPEPWRKRRRVPQKRWQLPRRQTPEHILWESQISQRMGGVWEPGAEENCISSSCERENEPSLFITDREFIIYLSKY